MPQRRKLSPTLLLQEFHISIVDHGLSQTLLLLLRSKSDTKSLILLSTLSHTLLFSDKRDVIGALYFSVKLGAIFLRH
jgi:hypothetical protein